MHIYMHIYKSFDFCSLKATNNDNKIPKSPKSSKLKNALSIWPSEITSKYRDLYSLWFW